MKLEIEFIREEYCDRRLIELESNLSNLIKELKKKTLISKRSDLLKY